MDPLRTRDWRDVVPGHIRVTGWRVDPDLEKETRSWLAMGHITVFMVCKGGDCWKLYGFRELGSFFGLKGEGLAGRWTFPKTYNGWKVEILARITKAQWAAEKNKGQQGKLLTRG